ncbi:MAG: 6-carboxytetrahydropterin synthase [Armatimonadetes bacterium]|nr:6-carboxytetrahydropterin synthase [Armatimonadota bacterium]MDW8122812.1 6-carboxytetrahydropterin synthase [Armatimonadota bacterium]
MKKIRLARTEYIDSGHFIPGHPKCGRPHGHTYRVDITIERELDRDMLLEFDEFKRRVWEVLAGYDHVMLNEVMEKVPTVENIAIELHGRLKEVLPGFRLTVRVWEGVRKWAEAGDE